MTSTKTRLAPRSGALLLAVALPVVATAPAHAEVPEGWSEPPDVGLLELLTVIVGIPAVLFAVIVAAVMAPALARGEKLLPSTSTPDQWFGGPDRPKAELESRSRDVGPTGGASGSW